MASETGVGSIMQGANPCPNLFYKRRRPSHGVRLNVWGDNTSAVIIKLEQRW